MNNYSINSHDPLIKEKISSDLGYLNNLPKAELFSAMFLLYRMIFIKNLILFLGSKISKVYL